MGEQAVVYPKRPSHFAMKAVRAMVKTCVANEHGQMVFCLLVTIVHTEDAAHYRRPVTFYEGQLMPLLGITSRTTFYRVRQRAIESGWLVCTHGERGKPAAYFVTIPAYASGLDDNPTDEGDEWQEDQTEGEPVPNQDQNMVLVRDQSRTKTKKWTENGANPGLKRAQRGASSGLKRGAFIPIPIPDPIPPPEDSCSEPSPKASKPEPVEVAMEFPVVGGKSPVWPLARSKLAEWADAFPGVSVEAECRKARQWCIDNPTKRKTAGGMTKFLNSWLSRAQNDGRSSGGASGSLFPASGNGQGRGFQSRNEQRIASSAAALLEFATDDDDEAGIRQVDGRIGPPQANDGVHQARIAGVVRGPAMLPVDGGQPGGDRDEPF